MICEVCGNAFRGEGRYHLGQLNCPDCSSEYINQPTIAEMNDLTEIHLVSGGGDPSIKLVDQGDNELCSIEYDDQPEEIIVKILRVVRDRTDIKIDLEEWE